MSEKKIVICGGGIIGCSVAYYLTKFGQTQVTLVERDVIAGQASGKAGGFLALDWNDGGPVGPLARRSFQLHDEVSRELAPRDVSYRRMSAWSVTVKESDGPQDQPDKGEVLQWIDAKVRRTSNIGTKDTSAQVHPLKLTNALLDVAKEKGANVVKGVVEGVKFGEGHQVIGVEVNGQVLDADVVVIAMGPWSGTASKFFPGSCLPNITGKRAHSVVLDVPGQEIGADAIFISCIDNEDKDQDPEIYPREDGTVYICGRSDDFPLPQNPANVEFNKDSCDSLARVGQHMSSKIKANSNITVRQACYLPVSPDHSPIIGQIPGYEGAYIATGHSCWGILNSLATGESLAQLILGLEPKVNLDELSPKRFKKH